MLNIKIKVDDREVIKKIEGLSPEGRMYAWARAIRELAEENARNRLGGGPFGERIADTVRHRVSGLHAEIAPEGQEGYIGVHVHFGGPINIGKKLAIPLPNESTRKYNPKRLFAKEQKFRMFKLRSRNGNELLFRKPGKGEKLEKPLFVLKDATAPQKPRPWWPTAAEVEAATDKFFEENF